MNIDTKITKMLKDHSTTMEVSIREAQETFEQAKKSGMIMKNAYDIPLMMRLSKDYVSEEQKIAAVTET